MNFTGLNPDLGGAVMAESLANTRKPENLLAGILEDDCAIWKNDVGYTVASQDFINIRPALLDLGVGDYYDLGRLAVKATISDLAASGARPSYLFCGCRFPANFTEKDFRLMARGVSDEANTYGCYIAGGDTKLGTELALIITGIGSSPSKEGLMPMTNAKPQDQVWVSGPLGSFAAAVYSHQSWSSLPDLRDWAHSVIKGQTVPLSLAQALSKKNLSCGATDISDGLSRDLTSLCKAAGVGARINLDGIPTDPWLKKIADEAGSNDWEFALASGGDFQFLVAARPEHEETLRSLNFHLIGSLTSELAIIYEARGQSVSVDPTIGHSDFNNKNFLEEISSFLSK